MNILATSNIKAVIFDMDGVLFDTEVLYEQFWCEAARQFGYCMTPEHVSRIRSTDSVLAEKITKSIFGEEFDYKAIRELRKKIMNEYIEGNGINLKPNIKRVLRFFKEKCGYKIAVATTSNSGRTKRFLKMGEIEEYFDVMVCSDMITKGKPDPMIYETAARQLGVLPEECLAFEDSNNGVISASSAGCNTFMVIDRDVPTSQIAGRVKSTLTDIGQIVGFYMSDTKLIVSDLDETLLSSHDELSELTQINMKKCIDMGIEFVVASGRSYNSLPKCIKEFKGIKYCITSNGAAVNDMRDGSVIKKFSMDENIVMEILDFTKELPYPLEAFVEGQAYAGKAYVNDPMPFVNNEKGAEYVKKTRIPVDNIRTFIIENKNNIDSISLVVDDDEIYNQSLKRFENRTYVTSSVKHLVEFASIEAGKSAGVEYISHLLNIDKKYIMTFGNGDNDADMLRSAGIGVAVANASKECLDAADYIADAYNEDGVAIVLRSKIH